MSRKPQQIEELEEDDELILPRPAPRSYIKQIECQADASFRYGDMSDNQGDNMKPKKKPAVEPTGLLGITTEQPLQPDSFESLLVPLHHQGLFKLHTQGGIEQDIDRTATRIFFKLGKLPSGNNVYFMLSDIHQLIGALQPEYLLLFHFPVKGQYLWWRCKPASAAGILEEEFSAMKQLDSLLIGYPMNSGYQLINSWYGARESAGCEQWIKSGMPEPGWTPIPA